MRSSTKVPSSSGLGTGQTDNEEPSAIRAHRVRTYRPQACQRPCQDPAGAAGLCVRLGGVQAEAIGEQLGVPWYTQYRDMLEHEPVDIVNVCTESGNHASVAIDIMQRFGCNVIVEKPMALW